jgi:hypothetical protein
MLMLHLDSAVRDLRCDSVRVPLPYVPAYMQTPDCYYVILICCNLVWYMK